jgi:hypothetical protein
MDAHNKRAHDDMSTVALADLALELSVSLHRVEDDEAAGEEHDDGE